MQKSRRPNRRQLAPTVPEERQKTVYYRQLSAHAAVALSWLGLSDLLMHCEKKLADFEQRVATSKENRLRR